jgi:hypothetical protein
MEVIKSINNVPIRIPDERWKHIFENHDDLAGYTDEITDALQYPDYVIEGYNNAKIAIRVIRLNKYLAVVYKEISKEDGFLITAYFTSKLILENEVILWQAK